MKEVTLKTRTGVDLGTGEILDVKEQEFIREYFKTAEMVRATKEALKGHKRMLDVIYEAYQEYQASKRQGKLFQ